MHYIFMPLEKGEFTKSKDVKVFDEKKNKEVKRRIKTTYKEKFNAKKLITKKLLNNLHVYMQKKIEERGISATIITPERIAFNNWKKERIEHYNKLIEQEPNKKNDYINAFWEEYQKMNPKDYKKNTRAKDNRLEQFNTMIEEYKEQQKEELEQAKKDIDDKNKKELESYKKQKDEKLEQDKKELVEFYDKEFEEFTRQEYRKLQQDKKGIVKDYKKELNDLGLNGYDTINVNDFNR